MLTNVPECSFSRNVPKVGPVNNVIFESLKFLYWGGGFTDEVVRVVGGGVNFRDSST